mgnify:CR=1 FL=1
MKLLPLQTFIYGCALGALVMHIATNPPGSRELRPVDPALLCEHFKATGRDHLCIGRLP